MVSGIISETYNEFGFAVSELVVIEIEVLIVGKSDQFGREDWMRMDHLFGEW
jgi:hypothetical protein